MISIVIASVNANFLANVKENIKTTIGCEYEVISFDNSKGQFSLCHLYNLGAQKAKYELICYMHEDIELRTGNWGSIVSDLFINNNELGILGVVGSSYKALIPSGWAVENFSGETIAANYIQSYKRLNKEKEHIFKKPNADNPTNVACVDGFWFCTRKSIVLEIGFDEALLQGFHCYDIDFCINVGRNFNVAVTFDILIHHFSEGSFDKNWLGYALKVHKKWKAILPIIVRPISLKKQAVLEKRAFKSLIPMLLDDMYTVNKLFKLLNSYSNHKVINRLLYLKLKFYIIKSAIMHKNSNA